MQAGHDVCELGPREQSSRLRQCALGVAVGAAIFVTEGRGVRAASCKLLIGVSLTCSALSWLVRRVRFSVTRSKGNGPFGAKSENTGYPSRRRVFAPIASAP
eukprot:6773108-Prymnesium_polylepis.1